MILWFYFCVLLDALGAHSPEWDQEWTLVDNLWDPVVGTLTAFGDFDNDHTVDALYLENDNSKGVDYLRLYCYDQGSQKMRHFQFDAGKTLTLTAPAKNMAVANIIPLDANFDGFLDLLVIYKGVSTQKYRYQVLQNNAVSKLGFKSVGEIEAEFDVEPLVADLNMDGIPDFLTQSSGSIKVIMSKLTDKQAHYEDPKHWKHAFDFNETDYSTATLRDPHASAIIDIDGDCKLDIALVLNPAKDSAEDRIVFFSSYALNNSVVDVRWKPLKVKNNDYGKSTSLDTTIPASAGHPVFADINSDGTNDIVYPIIDSVGNLEISVIYNMQTPICLSPVWREPGCKDSKDMCHVCTDGECKDVNFSKPTMVYTSQTIKIASEDMRKLWLRMADYDNDMYPDILVQTASEVSVLKAHAKEGESKDARKFVQYDEACKPWKPASGDTLLRSTFFDAGPVFGWKDVVIQTQGGMKVYGWEKRAASEGHTYHLMTTGLSGVCVVTPSQGCMKRGGTKDDDKHSGTKEGYGQSYPGVMFKLTQTNFQGKYIPRVSTQLAQQTYMSLQEPNVHFGLAQSNNYVSELFTALTVPPYASCPTDESKKYKRQNCPFYRHFVGSAIIPNTALRVIPYRREFPVEWELVLEVSPAKDILTILLVSTAILGALGGLITFNEYRDRKQQEKRQYRDFRVHFIG